MKGKLFECPEEDWKTLKLGELVTIKYGKMLPTRDLSESGFPVFGANGIIGCHTRYLYEEEQVLISCRGAYSGKVNLSPPQCYVTNNSLILELPPQPKVTKRFLFYGLQAVDKSKLVTGSAQPQVTINNAEVLEIAVPPLDQQQRIVAEIEKQFTRLEAGVAALRRVQANLKRYRAAVLKAACEGRLVSTEAKLAKTINERVKYETGAELLAQILTERRDWFDRQQANAKIARKYVVPEGPQTGNLPSLPEGWSWATWNQLSNWVTYGFTRPMPHVDEGIPIITAKGINRGRIDFDGADVTTKDAFVRLSEKDRPRPGDILVTKDGTIGRAAVVDTDREFCINQSVAVIWLRSCPMERKFLLTVIESEITQKPIWAKARGVAIQHLSITDFAKMALPIPPLAEQTRIVAEVERRLSLVEELESVVSANLPRATRLRQSILQKAFTGQLVASL